MRAVIGFPQIVGDRIGGFARLVPVEAGMPRMLSMPAECGVWRAGGGGVAGYHSGKHAMKIEITKEWCRRMAELKGDAEIGAGPLAFDPVFTDKSMPAVLGDEDESHIASGCFAARSESRAARTPEKGEALE